MSRVPSFTRALLLGALITLVAGCPGPPEPTREGGTPCQTETDCNPPGVTCGSLSLCIHDPGSSDGVCSATQATRACADGAAYPESGIMPGECLEYADCNPETNTCGLLYACTNFHCDTTPRLSVPCPDDGSVPTDATDPDADFDASGNDF